MTKARLILRRESTLGRCELTNLRRATCTVTTWEPNSISHSFSVGELAPNCEAKIVDDEAGLHEVKQGERGELWVRAPNVMKGYWGRPEATRETLTEDGWLRTGDIAYIDKENKLFIVDRKKVRMSAMNCEKSLQELTMNNVGTH